MGERWNPEKGPEGGPETERECPDCGGKGMVDGKTCEKCKGAGVILKR